MEEFSVRELADYRWHNRKDNYGELEDLVATNLAVSDIRSYDLEPDFGDMSEEKALYNLAHGAAMEVYVFNSELDSREFFELMTNDINHRISQEEELDQDLLSQDLRGSSLREVVHRLADYYGENFRAGENVEIEKVLENNGFHGRADIIRELDGEEEIRDIKTRYSDAPIPTPQDEFKMACYALISRDGLDIDSFVLEYPLQGVEEEVEPDQWFGEVAEKAHEFGELLEEGRQNQAELLRSDFQIETGRTPRDFVESLNIPYKVNKAYAWEALPEGIRE